MSRYPPRLFIFLTEPNIAADIASLTPAVSYIQTRYVRANTRYFRLDDLRFSNSITVEKNVLAGGSIGHIIRNRTTNPSTYVATDRWPVPP